MVVNLPPDLETALKEAAQKRGIPPEAVAISALRKQFLPSTDLWESRDEWERTLRSIAKDCGVSLPDVAVSSEGLYE
jgi:hypothetical protein